MKNNAVSKMDDMAFQDDPHNKPQSPHNQQNKHNNKNDWKK